MVAVRQPLLDAVVVVSTQASRKHYCHPSEELLSDQVGATCRRHVTVIASFLAFCSCYPHPSITSASFLPVHLRAGVSPILSTSFALIHPFASSRPPPLLTRTPSPRPSATITTTRHPRTSPSCPAYSKTSSSTTMRMNAAHYALKSSTSQTGISAHVPVVTRYATPKTRMSSCPGCHL